MAVATDRTVTPQYTLTITKPDGVRRGLIGTMVHHFEEKGLELRGIDVLTATPDQIRANYAGNEREPWFEEMVGYMTSGPIVPMAWFGPNAIESARQVIGSKDPWDSDAGTIRGKFAADPVRTVVHGSRTPEEALREIGIWFPALLGVEKAADDDEDEETESDRPLVLGLEDACEDNEDFRRVLWTGRAGQLVLMALAPGEEIGLEVHPDSDQILCLEEGEGRCVLGDTEASIGEDQAMFVPAGTRHNLINTGDETLKLYTFYSKAQHPRGLVEAVPAGFKRLQGILTILKTYHPLVR